VTRSLSGPALRETDGESLFDPAHHAHRRDGHHRRDMIAETDHCCHGFRQVDGWLRARGLLREGTVGHAPSKPADARDVVDVDLEHFRADPLVFLCPITAHCDECDAARASI
jgi:aminoglycoside 3-N-acetyltransferase